MLVLETGLPRGSAVRRFVPVLLVSGKVMLIPMYFLIGIWGTRPVGFTRPSSFVLFHDGRARC